MVAVGRETTPDCTRTRLPKSSNSTSFPGGRATLDSSGASSSLPCPLIIVPHCPPSSIIHSIQFTHISSSGFLVLLQVLSISISRSFQQHPLCKDNRCTKKNIQPPYLTSCGGVSIISRFRQRGTSIASSTRRTGLLALLIRAKDKNTDNSRPAQTHLPIAVSPFPHRKQI